MKLVFFLLGYAPATLDVEDSIDMGNPSGGARPSSEIHRPAHISGAAHSVVTLGREQDKHVSQTSGVTSAGS